MEEIVSKTPNLFWDGWTVVERIKSDKARTSKYGSCINGTWYLEKRFTPEQGGWSMPTRYGA